jgi:protein-disulfide isomerase
LPEIQSSYIATGKVKFVYRDFPLEQIHPNAMAAAIAAECADEQGKFWEYHDQLFGRQNEWAGLDENFAIERFKDYGARLSLDKMKFDPCLDSEKYLSEVNRDLEDAVKYGSTGTPTFFIGNEREGYVSVRGAQPYSVFQQVIERELSR